MVKLHGGESEGVRNMKPNWFLVPLRYIWFLPFWNKGNNSLVLLALSSDLRDWKAPAFA
jgi:hypothetical protein